MVRGETREVIRNCEGGKSAPNIISPMIVRDAIQKDASPKAGRSNDRKESKRMIGL